MRRRRRRKKRGKLRMTWRVLVALNALVISVGLYVAFTDQSAVKRWVTLRFIEGVGSQVVRNCRSIGK